VAGAAGNGKPSRPRPPVEEDEEETGGSSRTIVAAMVAMGVILFLLLAGGLGLYVVRALKNSGEKPADVASAQDKQKANEGDKDRAVVDPVIERPDPIERPKDREPINKDKDPIERPKDGDKKPPPEVPVDPATAKQIKINQAIDKGMVFLRKELERYLADNPRLDGPLGSFHEGIVSFAAMTLLECGVPANDPDIQKAAEFIRKQASGPGMGKTYNLATAILFFDKLGDPRDAGQIRAMAARLMFGQNPTGHWDYDCNRVEEPEANALLTYLGNVEPKVNFGLAGAKDKSPAARLLPLKAQNVAAVRWLTGVVPPLGERGDNSNTQFAMLGLWVAARSNVPVRASMALGADYFAATQSPDGSWGYRSAAPKEGRGSMTCAGLLGMAIGRNMGRKPNDASLQRGFKYLTGVYHGGHKETNGGKVVAADAADDLYYLWSLERVCLIYGLQKIGGQDWYAWESDILVGHQKQDGSWEDRHPPSTGTSFALLILKRVNVVKDLKIDQKIKDDVDKAANIKDTK
jgi:hypothetical protein